jgi:hypothetical protein
MLTAQCSGFSLQHCKNEGGGSLEGRKKGRMKGRKEGGRGDGRRKA